MLPKFIVYSLSFIVLILSTASIALAQTATPSALQPTTYNLPATVSPASPLYTDLLIHNMFHTFSCLAIGQSIIDQPCLTYLQGGPVLSKVNTSGGVLGATTNLIGMLYQNPPVRTADYLASLSGGFGIVREANAQVGGSGAAVLNPILKLWQVSRNISYVIMILIFMVIGLMIMFRNKINPQTVITAQTALPGLVIGLIMITFSFFFAGLISDMAFVGTNIVGYYFTAAQGKLSDPTFDEQLNLTQKLSEQNILKIMAPLTGIVTRERAEGAADSIISKLGDAIWPVRIAVFWLSAQFLQPIAGGIPPPWGLIAGPVVSLLGGVTTNIALPNALGFFLSFAASLALIYQMIKLLFKLIMAWLTIIFLTISAPFQFLIASLPGRQGMMTGWMLNMLGNILIFPAVVAVLYFVAFLIGNIDNNDHCLKDSKEDCILKVAPVSQINPKGFISPVYADEYARKGLNLNIVGTGTFPLLGGMDLDFVNILLAFGALMALPTIPDLVTKSIGRGGQAGAAIGQEIMGGFRQGQGYAQRTYMGGLNWAQGAKTNIFGEKQFSRNSEGKWVVSYGKPGWSDIRKGNIDMHSNPDSRTSTAPPTAGG